MPNNSTTLFKRVELFPHMIDPSSQLPIHVFIYNFESNIRMLMKAGRRDSEKISRSFLFVNSCRKIQPKTDAATASGSSYLPSNM